MDYQLIDISGDVGIRASGKDCAEAWVSAGIGTYSLITDLDQIEEKRSVEVRIAADSAEGLLVKFLNDLIFYFDAYNFIGKRIEVVEFSDGLFRANVFGDKFDPDRHVRKLLLKAATYHNIRIEKSNGICAVEVIFDI
jgi:SHS2 domain-containing protein